MTLWVVLIVLGNGVLIRYASTPGREGNVPTSWPRATRLYREPGRFTLVFAAHPQCPCTRASLSQLATITHDAAGRLSTRVLFVQPAGLPDPWMHSDLWEMVATFPGTKRVLDPQGREAKRFGALTSGQVALYDPQGHLVYSGGLTVARGEAGQAGIWAIGNVLSGNTAAPAWMPVFGCPLETPTTKPEEDP